MPLSPPRRIPLDDALMRPWTPGDRAALQRALDESDAHLRPWTPWVVDGKVAGQTLDERIVEHASRFDEGTEWVYGLFSPDERTVLGGAGLYPRVGPRAVEIGYWLAAGQTGRGLATRCAAALTRVAFAEPTVDHVEIRCARGNAPSNRVPARLGYRDSGGVAAAGEPDLVVWRLDRDAFASWTQVVTPS